MGGILADRAVDDQLNLSVGHQIQDVRPSLIQLFHPLRGEPRAGNHIVCAAGRQNPEAVFPEEAGNFLHLGLVLVIDGNQHGAFRRQRRVRALFRLEEGFSRGLRQAQHLSGGAHFRSQYGVHFREHAEGEHRFLHAIIRNLAILQPRHGRRTPRQILGNDLRSQRDHADAADLGHQRHSPGSPGIGLQHVHHIVLNGVLHIHQAYHMHLLRNAAGIIPDGLQMLGRNVL